MEEKHTYLNSCGGIARDNNGTWILGFAHRIGRSNSFQAEAWAVWSALRIAKDRNWPKVIIETDSFVVMQMIQQGCPNPHPLDFLFRKIRSLMNTWNYIVINHSGRNSNKLADALAHHGHSLSLEMSIFEECPTFCSSIAEEDCKG
ncbi:putative ribonuclease H protein At1g65750 family [Senna tora]|uniref:Putative ribonuclease H protein At1g65750 family n=1 Tax=Senna tora TaxID=362788 RepID=A0A834SRV9_9FABA|nr:putative ribonuclease H protein At1g65750 family [Senna tora]